MPEFTASDVAAALGLIEDEFSRELLCYLWLTDGARCSSSEIERMMLHRVMKECKPRAMEVAVTRLTYTMAELELMSARATSRTVAATLERYRTAMEVAEKRKWPAPRAMYRTMVRSVLQEIASPKFCPQCCGVGQFIHHAQHISCTNCDGAGAMMLSGLARARRLDMTWHAYNKAWKAPYEWAVESCRAAELAVDLALCMHLGYSQDTIPSGQAPLRQFVC